MKDWTQTRRDVVDPFRLEAMAYLMNRSTTATTTTLPYLWHFMCFRDLCSQKEMGVDGHPKRGIFLPDIALPKRMWAQSTFSFLKDIEVGDEMTRKSHVESIEEKTGKSGKLAFVRVCHEIFDKSNALSIVEKQDIVYKEKKDNERLNEIPMEDHDSHSSKVVSYSMTELFQFSALTYNAHRIHYDADYCREEEKYWGVVVHGPFLALTLMEFFHSETRGHYKVDTFKFRAVRPCFQGDKIELHFKTATEGNVKLWANTVGDGKFLLMECQMKIQFK